MRSKGQEVEGTVEWIREDHFLRYGTPIASALLAVSDSSYITCFGTGSGRYCVALHAAPRPAQQQQQQREEFAPAPRARGKCPESAGIDGRSTEESPCVFR